MVQGTRITPAFKLKAGVTFFFSEKGKSQNAEFRFLPFAEKSFFALLFRKIGGSAFFQIFLGLRFF